MSIDSYWRPYRGVKYMYTFCSEVNLVSCFDSCVTDNCVEDLISHTHTLLEYSISAAKTDFVREQVELVLRWWNDEGSLLLRTSGLYLSLLPSESELREKASSSIAATTDILDTSINSSGTVDDSVLSLLDWVTELPAMVSESFERIGIGTPILQCSTQSNPILVIDHYTYLEASGDIPAAA